MELLLQSLVTYLFVTYVHGLEFQFPRDNPCIIVQMNATFTLSNEKEQVTLKDPQLESNRSVCGNGSTTTLALEWKDTNDTMIFTFTKGEDKVEMYLIYEFIPAIHFKDSKDHNLMAMYGPTKELSMRNMSYKCEMPQDLKFNNTKYRLVMSVADVQIQAFDVENGNFSQYEECSEDSSTTTHPSQTTTGPPTTVSPPEEFTYMFPEKDPCIILESAIQLNIKYMDKNNMPGTAIVSIDRGTLVEVKGQCAVNDTGSAYIMLRWNYKHSIFSLKMDFNADKEAKLYKMEVHAQMLKDDYPELPTNKNFTSVGRVHLFESSHLTYYMCNSSEEVKLDNITTVVFDKIQVQAFGVKNGNFTGNGTECSQDSSTTVNPSSSTNPTTHTKESSTVTAQSIATMTTTESSTVTSQSTATMTTSNKITTTPVPNPTNNYSVRDGNVTCVYLVARIDFNIPYTTKNGTNTSLAHSVPQDFQTNGTCSTQNETTNQLDISFFHNNFTLTFVFGPDNSSSNLGDTQFKTYSVKSIILMYKMNPAIFEGYKENDTTTYYATANITGPLFQSKVNGSYKCSAESEVPLNGSIKLDILNLQYKAFNMDNSTAFGGDLTECKGDTPDNKTNSVVPIAVGAALAGLVVIVLIAYLIGRRRNRKGYESV